MKLSPEGISPGSARFFAGSVHKQEVSMNIYIDESGSIDRHAPANHHFMIALVHVLDIDKLSKSFKRFVSSNYSRLLELDEDKTDPNTGKILKTGGKMFRNGKFRELKGVQFDRDMKLRFVEYFIRKKYFEVYYIRIANHQLEKRLFENSARIFNYSLRLALEYFITSGLLPNEDCHLQLDERNEKKEARHFLENYLNTELGVGGISDGQFSVTYFDSAENRLIQVADIFANLLYSQEQTGQYGRELGILQKAGIVRQIFDFPSGNGSDFLRLNQTP